MKYIRDDTEMSTLLEEGYGNEVNKTKRRTTKKGIIVTCLIVAGIILGSFLVYLIP